MISTRNIFIALLSWASLSFLIVELLLSTRKLMTNRGLQVTNKINGLQSNHHSRLSDFIGKALNGSQKNVFKPGKPLFESPDLLQTIHLSTDKPIKKKTIIVVSQRRSGSTFTSVLLSHIQNTFLSLEPVFIYKSSTYSEPSESEINKFFESLLNCDIYKYSSYSKQLKFLVPLNMDSSFDFCLPIELTSPLDNFLCRIGEFMSFQCRRAKINLLKISIYPMKNILRFLSDPNMNIKIIHLLRDPRGILNSNSELGSYGTLGDTNFFCSNMRDDLCVAETVQEKYPKSYFRLLYEELAMYPVATMRRVLKFLEEPFTASFLHAINRHTLVFSETLNKLTFQLEKQSKSKAFRWRKLMSFNTVREIQNNCSDVIQKLGLRLFQSEDQYLNFSLAVWEKKIADS